MRSRLVLIRLTLVLLLLGAAWMAHKSWQEHKRNASIQKEIDVLKHEADKIRRENETLAQKIAYLASPDFQEQEAKQKLGLRRQEESVVALREQAVLPETLSESPQEVMAIRVPDMRPNYQKWWALFFE